MKRKMSQSNYRLLEKEFHHLEKNGQLAPNQADSLLSLYTPTEKISFVQTLLAIGSVLVGIGILSFIAGNWQVMPVTFKFLVLFLATAAFYVGGYKLDSAYPRTARSLYYIGIFVYGAGIFLIGQMFNLSEGVYADFLLWGIGILPLAYYLKDKFIALGITVFFSVYAFNTFGISGSLPYWLFILIPLLYWMNKHRMGQSKGLFIANVWLTLAFLFNTMLYFDFTFWGSMLVFFIIGLFLAFYPLAPYKFQTMWMGSIVYGISGLCLTLPYIWADSLSTSASSITATIFTIIFILKLIFFLKTGNLPAILITCLLIFRFYVDLSYDFMPKSLFFIIGGCILIGFGFWFERSRKGPVSNHEK